jgi:LEA14-like dessication related protein
MKSLLFALMLLVGLSSCRQIKHPELRGIENVRLDRFTLGQSTVEFQVRYFNPNSFNARMKEAEGDAWVDSVYLGHFKVDTLVMVPANSEFLIPVKLAVDMKYLMQNSMITMMKKEVLIRVDGKARAGRKGFYKNIRIKYEGMQDLSKLFKL